MVDVALDQIKALAATADESTRHSIMASLQKLAYSLELPDETVHRYGCLPLQTTIIEVGFNLGLFKLLVKSAGPLTVDEVAQKTGAEVLLAGRLLRYLASIGAVDEDSKRQYAANALTKNLADKVAEPGIRHYLYTCVPQYLAIPEYLKKNGYKSPTDELHTVFQDAYKTDKHAYAWFGDNPANLVYFNDFMALRRESDLSWLSVYPVEAATKGWHAEAPVYVNIGGSIGHQCAQFKAVHPNVPGRVILQDLPHSIAQALPTPGVENMVHNFWNPQPVHGAKFYFMRGVLHNHPDLKVQTLLELTKAAMTADSVLLIDEMILPETGVNVDTTSMDLTMLAAFASGERTEAQWRRLIEAAGLKLIKTYVYNGGSYESVMDVRLP
ncbi:S-adenosyl-L-methionine-dependent methyltransferase [Lasiosphaeria ovina]|uniref:S-adenosyl-L-methionine-dependent methyltransferase n=1 Tax=Lasiosphaeria ovina TaxID=92902 RepID=A0AAE0JSY9_9PEZI|nr:S-adenosyl-L-methionine-dependent methyltransferase [Lasiosphaeria ovina]